MKQYFFRCIIFDLSIDYFLGESLAGIPWEPEPRINEAWQAEHEAFKENSAQNGSNIHVLFYGDSITRAWGTVGKETFDELYAPLGTANYGIGGDRTEHVLYRIYYGECENIAPKVTVLKIGTNNIGYNTENDIVAGKLKSYDFLQKKNSVCLRLGLFAQEF